MKGTDLAARVLIVILYGCLTAAGVFFLARHAVRARKKKNVISMDYNLADSDTESSGTDEVLTAPSYVTNKHGPMLHDRTYKMTLMCSFCLLVSFA